MKRAIIMALTAASLAAASLANAQQREAVAKPTGSRTPRRTVVVDAGHGGFDKGMTARPSSGITIPEKDINLAIALKLADALRKRGVDVVLTRSTDVFVELNERGRKANASKADLFISIHVNAPGKPRSQERGFETYFLAEAQTEDERRVEAMENQDVRFETTATAKRDEPLSFILNDMAQNEHLRESSDLAATIQEFLGPSHPGPSRGVKQANFAVLRTAFMPAVLVETGFGTHGREAQWLSSDNGQRAIASSIADATMKYLDNYAKRLNASSAQR